MAIAAFDESTLYEGQNLAIVTLNGGKDWNAAEIVQIDYKLKKNDLKYCRRSEEKKSVRDTVPYRVKFLKDGALRPVLDKSWMRNWNGENFVRYRLDVSFFNSNIDGIAEFPKLFKLAVKLRNLPAARWLYKYAQQNAANQVDQIDGKDLLTSAIHYEQSSMIPASSIDSDREASLVKELAQLLEWLKENYQHGYDDYTDNLDRKPEHIAALRGDLVLLRHVLNKPTSGHPLDRLQTAPFMYAARKGHVHLLDMYVHEIMHSIKSSCDKRSSTRWKEEDLNIRNVQTKTCWNLAKNEETTAKLHNIRQVIRGEKLIPRLTVKEYQNKILELESELRQTLFSSNLQIKRLDALVTEAQAQSESYISMNSNLRGIEMDLKREHLVLGGMDVCLALKPSDLNDLVQNDETGKLLWLRERLPDDQCYAALCEAAAYDKLTAFIILSAKVDLMKPVDKTGRVHAIEIAVKKLSAKVVSYLLSNSVVAKSQLQRGSTLIGYCIDIYDQDPKSPMDPEDRTEIMKLLDGFVTNVNYQLNLEDAISNLLFIREDDVPIPESVIAWLVEEKGCDILSCIKKPLDKYIPFAPWLEEVYNKAMDARIHREKTEIALKAQPHIRGFLCRHRIMKEHNDFGTWSELIIKINTMKASPLSKTFGRTWAELKLENKYVSKSNEFDIYEDEALGVVGENDGREQFDARLEEGIEENEDDFPEYTDDMIGGKPGEAIVCNILLTSEALKWLKSRKDNKYRELFHKRIDQLARGGQSYCLSKKLKGSKHGAWETKLDKGQRIIWTERRTERMVWFICKHDKISRCCELIDLSYDRVIRAEAHEEFSVGEKLDDEPEMLANPIANVPLKIHAVEVDTLSRLLVDTEWTPPLRLTTNEQSIVNTPGSVLLIGRSGTGKTLCVCNRMTRDHAVYGDKIRQLFVSRTSRLCDYVEALQKRAGEDMTRVRMTRIDDLIDEVSKVVLPEKKWLDRSYVTFDRFCAMDIWGKTKGEEAGLDPEQIWTQIRSFIKGSCEATLDQRPLTEEEYLDFDIISKNRCRLNLDQRRSAYSIFDRYQRLIGEMGYWDEVDRARLVYAAAKEHFTDEGFDKDLVYDRVYIDEIQDITQAEITLLILLTGNNYDAMFFAGDTAQTVSQGVDFRFEELRQVVYKISGGKAKDKLQKPERLARNFRSHNGILSVSNLVLNRLHAAFPAAASKLPPDTGLVLGPRPGLITMTYQQLSHLIEKNSRLRILVRDESKSRIHDSIGNEAAARSCLGIREAKGLEFRDVVILNFFGSSAIGEKVWKNLLLGDPRKEMRKTDYNTIPISMELELKLLYTAITRSCDRLFFIETASSKTYESWRRCLKRDELAQDLKPDDFIEQGVMTADDWMIEGIEIASQVSDSGMADAVAMLERAIGNFQKASEKKYEEKCVANLKALKLQAEAETFHQDASSTGDRSLDESLRRMAAKAVSAYLDAEMVNEATRACRRLCSNSGLSSFLISEIQELRRRAMEKAKEELGSVRQGY